MINSDNRAAPLTRSEHLHIVATSMAEILVADGTDLGDEREIERVIRRHHPDDRLGEVDHLVEICPDIARSIIAERGAEVA